MKEVMSNVISIETSSKYSGVANQGTAETKETNTLFDYVFVIVLFAVAMFFPFEAFLLWLGAKGKEWLEHKHAGCDKQARVVKYM